MQSLKQFAVQEVFPTYVLKYHIIHSHLLNMVCSPAVWGVGMGGGGREGGWDNAISAMLLLINPCPSE